MSQCKRILAYLKTGKTLTRRIGLDELGIWESPARISELKQQGANIKTQRVSVVDRFGEAALIAHWTLGGES